MFKRFASVNQCIHHPFIIGLKCFCDDSYDFLKETLYSFGNGKLYYTVRCLMKETSDGLIGSKTFDCTQDGILKHRNRDTGNLGCKIPGLRFPQSEQTFGLFEIYFDYPSSGINPVGFIEVQFDIGRQ